MRYLVSIALAASLAACGADGEPAFPEPGPKPGLSITGRAEVGVARTS